MKSVRPSIELRPVSENDVEFLFDLYAGTRAAEVAAFGWEPSQQEAFLRMQFNGRRVAYRMQFPTAENSVIIFEGKPSGEMIVNRSNDEIVLTDIAVLPEFRGNGIASELIDELKAEAVERSVPVVLRVDKTNMYARSFYDKRGFVVIAESDILWSMEWKA